jgi:tetratricopeptide (TPR) repeat protein
MSLARARPAPRAWLALLACLLFGLPALPAPAGDTPPAGDTADPLAVARQHMDEVRFDQAFEVLDRALRAGRCRPAQLAQIYRLLGELAVGLGRTEEARDHFARLLALEPGTTLAEGTSPKITDVFAEARTRLGTHSLRIAGRADPRRPALITLVVTDDPMRMVSGARLSYRRGDGSQRAVEGPGSQSIDLELPADAPPTVVLSALDTHGNVLREVPVARTTPAVSREAPARRPARRRSLWTRWWLWGSGAVAAGLAGGFFALRAGSDQQELDEIIAASDRHYFREAEALEQRARRNALMANVSFGAAAALAVTGAIFFLADRGAASDGPAIALQPLPGPGGAVALQLPF